MIKTYGSISPPLSHIEQTVSYPILCCPSGFSSSNWTFSSSWVHNKFWFHCRKNILLVNQLNIEQERISKIKYR